MSFEYIGLGAQSIEHYNVLSEKTSFLSPGGSKVTIFGTGDLDPLYIDVSNFSVPPLCLKCPHVLFLALFGSPI